ncbi:MAG: hypothetical protein NZ739_02285 [Verrucomicrobiae bacterium]|nr:hypothetical protein [Verrucomicrobiae bacterium]MCX7723431.1 hypothetical protein [Verrucomicrobiae bacterium]
MFNPTNGSVALVAGRIARFVPSASADALGGFAFSVTDTDGDSMTNTVGVRIISATVPSVQPPVLGIRSQGDSLYIEIVGQSGRTTKVFVSSDLQTWSEWTNVLGTGAPQLLPIPAYTNAPRRFFRALTQ